jgi:hypothetical protein
MKSAEETIRELLQACPFDETIRDEHRREVLQRALNEYDAAAARGADAAAGASKSLPVRFARRPVVRHAIAAALAASLGAALAYWYVRNDGSPSPNQLQAASQAAALEKAHRELAAALKQLRYFEEERAASFALGVQACLGEHDSQMAALGSAPTSSSDRATN